MLRKQLIVHRDIKMANILKHGDNIKIGDFGSAKMGNVMSRTQVGTVSHMAPEVLVYNEDSIKNNVTQDKVDLWAIGVIFYQMLQGKLPFEGFGYQDYFYNIKQNYNKLKFKVKVSEDAKDLIQNLLQLDPKKRLNWA